MKPADTTYGYQELRDLYKRYMSFALTIAVSVLLAVAAILTASERFKLADNKFAGSFTVIVDGWDYPPPIRPHIEDTTIIPEVPKDLANRTPTPIYNREADTNTIVRLRMNYREK